MLRSQFHLLKHTSTGKPNLFKKKAIVLNKNSINSERTVET